MAQASTRKGHRRRKIWNYPRRGLGPVRRWMPSWRFLVASFFSFIALGAATFAALYIFIKVPDPSDFALAKRTTITYSDAHTQMGTFADYDRVPVKLETLPNYVSTAIVASEDQTFYTNNGIDLKGIARAIVNNVKGGARQGGSTLTQQYVERFYLGTTTGYAGKLKEAILALKIDRQQSKEEILENYLNTIYFGRGAYGIQVAAQKYFGIDASQLSLSQTALLVAVVPAPSAWDPAINPERAQERWQRVLTNMVKEGYLDQSEANAQTFPETREPKQNSSFAGPAGYVLQAATNELINSGKFTADDLNTGGYTIVTTIDKEKQEAAIAAVDALPEDRPENNYVSLVSADPKTGAIYALYGGKDYLERERNGVTQDRAQGGSTFKPFTLVAALENGIPLSKRYASSTPMKIGDIEVQNFDGIDRGHINLLTATKYSVNTVFVQLNAEVGPDKTRDVAIRAGIPEDTPGLDSTTTNVLGSASPRSIDMLRAYATFANQGVRHEMYLVSKVVNASGEEVYSGKNGGKRVFDSNVMAQLTEALEGVTQRQATGATAGKLERPVAGKTGTSSGPWSAWFAGYIPQMVTVVDMYQIGPNGEEQVLDGFGKYWYGIGGGSFPAEVWLRYMEKATEGMPVENFVKPEGATASPIPRNVPEEKETTAPEDAGETEQIPAPANPVNPAPSPAGGAATPVQGAGSGSSSSGESDSTNGGSGGSSEVNNSEEGGDSGESGVGSGGNSDGNG